MVVHCSHPGTGKYFTVASRASGLVMHVDGDVIEAGSLVILTNKAVSKVKGRDTVPLRQQFCCDELTGTIRSALRYYCLDIGHSMSSLVYLFSEEQGCKVVIVL